MIERARVREVKNEEKQKAKMSLTCKRRKKKETYDRNMDGRARRASALERAREKGTCNNTTKGGFARAILYLPV